MIETLDQLLAYPGPFLTADVAVQATSTNPILPEAMAQAHSIMDERRKLERERRKAAPPISELAFQMGNGSPVVPAGKTIAVKIERDSTGRPVRAVGRVVEEGL